MATAKTNKNKSKKSIKKNAKKSAVKRSPHPDTALAITNAVTDDNTALDTLYIVDGSNSKITLEVNAGAENQTSLMTITLDDKIIEENLSGDFIETPLGTNNQLNGQILRIVATITDTSQVTNFTSLTILLKGGLEDIEYPLSKTVNADGDSADYICRIEFFKP